MFIRKEQRRMRHPKVKTQAPDVRMTPLKPKDMNIRPPTGGPNIDPHPYIVSIQAGPEAFSSSFPFSVFGLKLKDVCAART